MNTDASLPNTTVSWTPPTASDNSGEVVTLTSDYSPGDTFPIGTTTVTYTAMDVYGNMATCTFNVVVTGKYDKQLINRESKLYQLFRFVMLHFFLFLFCVINCHFFSNNTVKYFTYIFFLLLEYLLAIFYLKRRADYP